ncbi:hypothetical protein KKE26_12965 [bacterium]|nr:hypothetical protein [bacterium]
MSICSCRACPCQSVAAGLVPVNTQEATTRVAVTKSTNSCNYRTPVMIPFCPFTQMKIIEKILTMGVSCAKLNDIGIRGMRHAGILWNDWRFSSNA